MDRAKKGIDAYKAVLGGSQKDPRDSEEPVNDSAGRKPKKPVGRDDGGTLRRNVSDTGKGPAGYPTQVPVEREPADGGSGRRRSTRAPQDGETESHLHGENKSPKNPGAGPGRNASLAGFLKAGTAPSGKYRKIAKFLLLIGKESASEILSHLPPEELNAITHEMSRIGRIEKDEANLILKEFGQRSPAGPAGTGGPETAKAMLRAAFGAEEGDRLFQRAVPFGGRRPFDFLSDLDADQLTILLRKESVTVLSIVLPHLDSAQASRLLEALPPEKQKEVVRRVAKMGRVHPDAVTTTEAGLRDRIRRIGTSVTQEIDGISALTEILRAMDSGTEQGILHHLADTVPEVSEAVRRRLFSLETLRGLPKKELQSILREFSDEELALVLKGRDELAVTEMLSGVSERRRDFIRQEMARLGAVRRSDVEYATREMLNRVREMAEKGDIQLTAKDDMYV